MPETPAAHAFERSASSALSVAVSALLGGLAGGVAWCLIVLSFEWAATFGIVPIAFALGAFARWQGYRQRAAIACGVVAIGVTFLYAHYLFGAVHIADAMGLPLRDTLFKAGFALTFDIARANMYARDWLAFALAQLAAISSASLGARTRRSA